MSKSPRSAKNVYFGIGQLGRKQPRIVNEDPTNKREAPAEGQKSLECPNSAIEIELVDYMMSTFPHILVDVLQQEPGEGHDPSGQAVVFGSSVDSNACRLCCSGTDALLPVQEAKRSRLADLAQAAQQVCGLQGGLEWWARIVKIVQG